MSIRDWLRWLSFLVFQTAAIILIARVGIETYQAFQRSRYDYQSYRDQERQKTYAASNEIASECGVGDAPSGWVAECLSEQINTYIQEDHTDKDLQAQQDMAYWGQATFWLAGAGALISLGGLIALLISLRQTRTAIADTREIGEAQVRAYLGITHDDNDLTVDALIVGETPTVKFSVKNTGNSPARAFRYIATCDIVADPFPKTNDDLVRPVAADGIPADVVPQGETFGGAAICVREITKEDIDAILDVGGDTAFYMFGILYYEDVFGKPHRSRFCYRLVPLSVEQIDGGAAVTSGWQTTTKHNDAD